LVTFYISHAVAHNADSTVVAVVGASLTGGMNYKMVTSTGQQVALPKMFGGRALISPDGKTSVALYPGDNGNGFDVYPRKRAKFSISNFIYGPGLGCATAAVFLMWN